MVCIAFTISTEYFKYYTILKYITIISPILSAFLTAIFINKNIFPNVNRILISFLKSEKTLQKLSKYSIIIIINLFTFFIIYQLSRTHVIFVRSNADAQIIDTYNNCENNLGIIPLNQLTEIRLFKGKHILLFDNKKQIIQQIINLEGEKIEPLVINFENIILEKVELKKDVLNPVDSLPILQKHSITTVDYFNQANDELSQYMFNMDRGQRPVSEIINSLASYTSNYVEEKSIYPFLALIYQAYIHNNGESIYCEWCAQAISDIIKNVKVMDLIILHLQSHYNEFNFMNKILIIVFIETSLKEKQIDEKKYATLKKYLIKDSNHTISSYSQNLGKNISIKKLALIFNHQLKKIIESKKNLPIIIEQFEIDKRFSLYHSELYGRKREYEISPYERTFFKYESNDPLFKHSDYLDFIGITNKISQKELLSSNEEAFLKKSKPVFNITIHNNYDHQILLKKIILIVKSVSVVLGGGSRILRPEIMYEIDVPTKVGSYHYPVLENQLIIDGKSFGNFLLGLNSTNKTVLKNGAIMYPQLDYEIGIIFDFGIDGKTKSMDFKILL